MASLDSENNYVPSSDGDGQFQVSKVIDANASMASGTSEAQMLNAHFNGTEMAGVENIPREGAPTEQSEMSSFGGGGRLGSMELGEEDDGVGLSLPTPDEIRATVNPRPARTHRAPVVSEKVIICGFVLFLALVFMAVGLGVGLETKKEEDEEAEFLAKPVRPEAIQLYLIEKSISSEDDFDESTSPQSRAAAWMATQDKLKYPIPNVQDDFKDLSQNNAAYEYVLRYIMAVVYFSTGGDEGWVFDYNFLTDLPTCDWHVYRNSRDGENIPYGLTCNESQAYSLNLANQDAVGSIPSELGLLDTLVEINFSTNAQLSGRFPPSFCNFRQLRSLRIGFTTLQGSLPPCINQLSELAELFLSNNDLNGQLPLMTNMTNLKTVHLDDNSFAGDITTAFDNMLALEYLFLEDNSFSGTINDFFLIQNSQLRIIDISDNPLLRGTVPVHLFEFPRLQLIDMHGCGGITGPFPDLLVPNDSLRFLAFQGCNITGPIPSSLSKLPGLIHLDLSGNQLTGEIPSELGALSELRYLFLSDNKRLTPGEIPESFSQLVHMEEFSLKRTKRFGFLPEFIAAWTNLTLLDLGDNSFGGNLPPSYGNLTNLQFFLVNGNGVLEGEVPDSYKNLVKLRFMFLEDNGFEGDLGQMCSLPAFNGLSGSGLELVVADCDGGKITCECCVCCDPNSPNDASNSCNNNDITPNLNPHWETDYKRVVYNFGNESSMDNY